MKKYASGRWMKKTGKAVVTMMVLVSLWLTLPVSAREVQAMGADVTGSIVWENAEETGESTEVDLTEMFSGVQDQITEALEQMDAKTAGEMFDFVKEKISDGSLKTEEGLTKAIEEGESRFGVTIDRETAVQVVDTMEKLEAMGFSSEEIIGKAKELYEKYGAQFIEHANEAVTEAVEEAVTNAVQSFFGNLWEEAKNFFSNLISGF